MLTSSLLQSDAGGKRGRLKNSSHTFSANSSQGGDRAEAIGGNQNLHLGKHLQDYGDADRQLEPVVAAVSARYADSADHAFHTVGHDRFIGDGQENVLVNRNDALADVLHTAGCLRTGCR